ncbi:MAG: 2-oxoacid:ferredoxin oxidoreductase subunit beta [Phycisphaerae bacterium]|jgi:2-oxoglutarate/2-oxoacid ferredoxin oxidoreductase subunit beta|nr:2-oxoacid:ferredoxin oxidoreductase subunit beta [Phycisphaerae bacterium]HJN71023.1 2-oxoacid:ferredoxin oxidoreductase subunit beta [Phycisphaerales bacterium]|tara:strand:+ start:1050 stop:2054 length:1005 start_codon:yes stop_codon:yes gene_type:complete
MSDVSLPTYKPKDFATDQDVRWCPGCGDYAVLTAMRKTVANLGVKREDVVFVSGIGCAARFPYYMNTYGAHTLHGRAPAFATGVKLANSALTVFVVSGDGDLLSIGGNHTIHTMRRNIDINIVLLNNKIYGLTKGQYSPTSEVGKITKSTPHGSLDAPMNPIAMAIASGCTYVARSLDVDVKLLTQLLDRGARHRGTSFVEVYQDCNVFNHEAWFYASQKDTRSENTILLEHGKPLVFGKEHENAICRVGDAIEIGSPESDSVLVHDETSIEQAFLLSQLFQPAFPEPLGVFYIDDSQPTYNDMLHEQIDDVKTKHGDVDLQTLVSGSHTWTIR